MSFGLKAFTLIFADLEDADFWFSNLIRSNFDYTLLEDADFRFAILNNLVINGSRFVGANLSGSDLSNTDLSNIDFSLSQTTDVNFMYTKWFDIQNNVINWDTLKSLNNIENSISTLSIASHIKNKKNYQNYQTWASKDSQDDISNVDFKISVEDICFIISVEDTTNLTVVDKVFLNTLPCD